MTDLDYSSEPMPAYFDDGQYRPLHFWLSFDYRRPPLTANQRIHWRRKAEITAAVRTATMLNARRIPNLTRCEVALTWYVTDQRRRRGQPCADVESDVRRTGRRGSRS